MEQLALTSQDTKSWLEQLVELILVNEPEDVTDGKKVAILLRSIGQKGDDLLRAWCGTDLPNTKTFAVLTKMLTDHLCPTPPKRSERFKFYQVSRRPNESFVGCENSKCTVKLGNCTDECTSFSEGDVQGGGRVINKYVRIELR